MKITSVFMFLIVFLIASNAHACLGPPLNSTVLLRSLPIKALEKKFVALVEITEPSKVDFQSFSAGDKYIKAKVIYPIKSAKDDQNIKIKFENHNCYSGHDVEIGDKYYIAGNLSLLNIFTGEWQEQDLNTHLY
jgi:hypothetical protein